MNFIFIIKDRRKGTGTKNKEQGSKGTKEQGTREEKNKGTREL
jgi:hypothetical protein